MRIGIWAHNRSIYCATVCICGAKKSSYSNHYNDINDCPQASHSQLECFCFAFCLNVQLIFAWKYITTISNKCLIIILAAKHHHCHYRHSILCCRLLLFFVIFPLSDSVSLSRALRWPTQRIRWVCVCSLRMTLQPSTCKNAYYLWFFCFTSNLSMATSFCCYDVLDEWQQRSICRLNHVVIVQCDVYAHFYDWTHRESKFIDNQRANGRHIFAFEKLSCDDTKSTCFHCFRQKCISVCSWCMKCDLR